MMPKSPWPNAGCRLTLLYSLYFLVIIDHALATPVSSPEISNKSAKSINLSGHQQQHQQQQQQLQQQQQKLNQQEAHLNSLNAYAANYESIGANGNQQANFKPSYKLPEMETNFSPIQSSATPAASGLLNPTPVLMQYLPQTGHEGDGVQYLQLIPTRPLIVPISSYLPGGGTHPVISPTYHHQPLTAGNSIADYAGRSTAVLTGVPANGAAPAPAPTLVDLHSNGPPYGIHTYAAALQPYRSSYRFNRETRQHLPPSFNLNLNEYIPGPHDPPHPIYIRGRP